MWCEVLNKYVEMENKGRSRRGNSYSSSTAAAAGGRTSCRTSQNFAAIGALLYDAQFVASLKTSFKYVLLIPKSRSKNREQSTRISMIWRDLIRSTFDIEPSIFMQAY